MPPAPGSDQGPCARAVHTLLPSARVAFWLCLWQDTRATLRRLLLATGSRPPEPTDSLPRGPTGGHRRGTRLRGNSPPSHSCRPRVYLAVWVSHFLLALAASAGLLGGATLGAQHTAHQAFATVSLRALMVPPSRALPGKCRYPPPGYAGGPPPPGYGPPPPGYGAPPQTVVVQQRPGGGGGDDCCAAWSVLGGHAGLASWHVNVFLPC